MASNNIKKVFYLSNIALYTVINPMLTNREAVGFPVYKSLEYPIVSSLDSDNPICYIQQSNGSTLNLSQLCSNKKTRKQLSQIDRKFLDIYNNLLAAHENTQTFVSPDTAKDQQSPIQTAQNVCTALKNKVPLAQIKTDQYQTILETQDKRNQQLALAESEIIDSLAVKFYCPEFAK